MKAVPSLVVEAIDAERQRLSGETFQALGHNQPDRLAVLDQRGRWAVFSGDWDHEVAAPLRWAEDDQHVLFAAEDRGRRHLWQFALGDRRADIVFEGGHVGSFAQAAAMESLPPQQ